MVTGDGTKKCPYCAEDVKIGAIFCRFCGKKIGVEASIPPQPYMTPAPTAQPYIAPTNSTQSSGNIGLSIASLIIGVISIVISLVDLGQISDGTYYYIENSEIGLLAIMSFTALGLGIPAKVKKQKPGLAALIVSIVAVVFMFSCASYTI